MQREKIVQYMNKIPRSSLILLIMTLWWIIPFAARDFWECPLRQYFSSHLIYLLTATASILFAAALGVLDRILNLWQKLRFWGKYLIIMATYAVQMILLVMYLMSLDSQGTLKYYGGDACGSIGIMYLPSIAFYILIGACVGIILQGWRWIMNRSGFEIRKRD